MSKATRKERADAEWGDLATAAKAADALAPVWKKFIKTRFYVAILRSPDDDPKNFLLHTTGNSDDGDLLLVISEVRERLDPQQGDGIAPLSGADILRRLDDQAGIEVALGEAPFRISSKRARWLRSGIEVTKARVVTRGILRAAAPAAPLPVLRVGAESEDEPPSEPPIPKALYWKLVALALAVIGVLATLVMALMMAFGTVKVQAPVEAPLPAKPARIPASHAASAALLVAPEAMVTFTAAYDSFSVRLPGLAEEVEASPDQIRRMGDVESHQYRLRADDRMYTMEASFYRRQRMPSDLSAEMDAAQKSIVGSDGTLIRATPIAMRGAIAREVRVSLHSGGERAARYAFIGNRFCAVMVTVPNGPHSAPQVEAFLNSFQLN